MFLSKFEWQNDVPNEQQVEEWAEAFFHNLLTVFNTFFSYVDVQEAVSRMADIPFDKLVREALEGEREVAVDIAVARVNELFQEELDFMRAYAE